MSSNELLNKESSKVGSKGYFQGKEKNPTGNTEQYKERETAESTPCSPVSRFLRVLKLEKWIRMQPFK